jgi:hypothetical protein
MIEMKQHTQESFVWLAVIVFIGFSLTMSTVFLIRLLTSAGAS